MNWNGHRHAAGGLPILSAALMSAMGLLWDGAQSSATAQTYSGASSNVIVDYDALNALPGQPANGAQAGYMQPQPQFAPGHAPYGTVPPLAPAMAPGLAAPTPEFPAAG